MLRCKLWKPLSPAAFLHALHIITITIIVIITTLIINIILFTIIVQVCSLNTHHIFIFTGKSFTFAWTQPSPYHPPCTAATFTFMCCSL